MKALGLLLVLRPVDATEAQRLLADVELVEAGQAGADDDVALLAELVGAAQTLVENRPQALLGVGAELVEPFVGPVDVSLLRLQLRICAHSRSFVHLHAFTRAYTGKR